MFRSPEEIRRRNNNMGYICLTLLLAGIGGGIALIIVGVRDVKSNHAHDRFNCIIATSEIWWREECVSCNRAKDCRIEIKTLASVVELHNLGQVNLLHFCSDSKDPDQCHNSATAKEWYQNNTVPCYRKNNNTDIFWASQTANSGVLCSGLWGWGVTLLILSILIFGLFVFISLLSFCKEKYSTGVTRYGNLLATTSNVAI